MIENKIAKQGVRRLLVLQVIVTAILSGLFLFDSQRAAFSAFLGCLVCLLPSQYFAAKVFKHTGAQAAKKIMKAFYLGEALKIALTIALFALVFLYVDIAPGPFFTGFIGLQLLFWVTPWLFTK